MINDGPFPIGILSDEASSLLDVMRRAIIHAIDRVGQRSG
jgi:hypothetical protein